MREIFLARVNSDSTEGRGPMRTIGYFANEADARKAVEGQGVMGVGDGTVENVFLADTYDEWRKIDLRNDRDYRMYRELRNRYESIERELGLFD